MQDNAVPHKRKRAMTFSKSDMPSFAHNLTEMDENLPLIDFLEYYDDDIRTEIDQMSFDSVVDSSGSRIEPLLPEIIKQFETSDIKQLLSSPQPPLIKLKEAVNECIPYNVVSQMIKYWPPIVPTNDPRSKQCLFLLLKIIQDSKFPQVAIQWLSNVAFDMSFFNKSARENPSLKAICVCNPAVAKKAKKSKDNKQGNSISWADIDKNNEFSFYNYTANNQSLRITRRGTCTSIVVNKSTSTVQVKESNKIIMEFTPIDKKQLDYWEKVNTSDSPYFPLMLSNISIERPLPSKLLPAFYRCLIGDDLLVLKALLCYKVTKAGNSAGLMEALFDIFSYAGKVNEFILTSAIVEFQTPNLSSGTILRGTSQLSNLLKVFYEKFGVNYILKSLKNAIKYIDKAGNLNLKNPIQSPVSRVYTVLFRVIKHILKSGNEVPPEMRHLASILKAVTSMRFNSKQVVYNVLNNFFYLRFINAYMVLPKKVGIETINDTREVLIPFASLLGYVFNLQPMRDKYEPFNTWNPRLTKHTFNDIVDFVFSVCEIDEIPTYKPPPPDKLQKSLELVLETLSKNYEAFCVEYDRLVKNHTEMSVPGWIFGSLLQRYFQENVTLFTS